MSVRVLVGHVLDKLRELPDESVHCVVTSPPYYGLRSYNTPDQVWGPSSTLRSFVENGGVRYETCEHEWGDERVVATGNAPSSKSTLTTNNGRGPLPGDKYQHENVGTASTGTFCLRCGAWRGSLGLEPSLSLYLDHMVEICREIRRVLRKDGTFWLNVGDSFCSTDKWGGGKNGNSGKHTVSDDGEVPSWAVRGRKQKMPNLKPKDLMMIPARLAIRLQEDGWWLRSDIIFAKRAPMPEPARDRPTSAHEHIFLLTKSRRYFFDRVALSQAIADDEQDLHEMFNRKDGESVPPREEGQERPILTMSGMLDGSHEGSSRNGERTGSFDRVGSSIQDVPGRGGQAGAIQGNPEVQGCAESVGEERCGEDERCSIPQIREAKSRSEEALRERQGTSDNRSLSPDSEGSGVIGAGRSQAARQDADKEHANGQRVGDHQGTREAQMSLLPPRDEEADDGSRNSDQQRRASCGVEHRPGVSQLQRQEKQQSTASNLTNARNVWWLSPEPFPEAHFATFPTEIPRRAILAGTSARGCCPKCGAGWERVTARSKQPTAYASVKYDERDPRFRTKRNMGQRYQDEADANPVETIGWRPTCSCDAGAPIPATCLDPFAGAGTTLLVADRLGRHCIGIELSESYSKMAADRITADAGMFSDVAVSAPDNGHLPSTPRGNDTSGKVLLDYQEHVIGSIDKGSCDAH